MTVEGLHVTLFVDGGSRGNPGPAAAGFVICDAKDGAVLQERGVFLGKATNNVAEYQALVVGLKAAQALAARKVDAFSDSELLVRQMNGQYRVRNPKLQPLFLQARELAARFDGFVIRHVGRQENRHADLLVNLAMDRRCSVDDAGG